jgi:hypothetical protein
VNAPTSSLSWLAIPTSSSPAVLIWVLDAADCSAEADTCSVLALVLPATAATRLVASRTRPIDMPTLSTPSASPLNASRVSAAVLEADSASCLTSSATTANPRLRSSARTASIAALSASRFV